MISTLAGAVVDIILDPIFIFLFKWGMMGAAVATVIGQAVTVALAVVGIVMIFACVNKACFIFLQAWEKPLRPQCYL